MASLFTKPFLFIATGAAAVLLFIFVTPSFYGLSPCSDGICLPHPQAKGQFSHPKSLRVKNRYGPFTVPGMDEDAGMREFQSDLAMPCSDCVITHIQADLEYPDGSYANANTGMWLHHVVVYNMNRTDATCSEGTYPQRIFASGNERTKFDVTMGGRINSGYYIKPGDTFSFGLELMNEVPQPRDAILTIELQYLPTVPLGFKPLTPIWLDIDDEFGCGERGSELPPPDDTETFSFGMDDHHPWTVPFDGTVVLVGGHIHDGGLNLEFRRDGEVVCDSVARYGESEGYVDGRMAHISSMGTCTGIEVRRGERWTVRANYDFGRWMPMMEGERVASVMGIGLLYVA
ncbi:hypothetical protein GE09DRAFT_237012 [Coniochaeta sp. 2T2.1]|nr:hypothetical protein GE09DRAFT_237012 [Coniochaeta sp. 2T2.1]